MNRKKILKAIIFYALGAILVLIWMMPFVISIFTSLKSMDEILLGTKWWSLPKKVSFENYSIAWKEANMKKYFLNTLIITGISVAGALFVSSLGAFALSWCDFKLKKPLLIMFVAGMLIPFQMLMIPVYRFSVRTGLYDTYWGVILFHIAFQTGFCTFFLRNFMVTIPKSLFEAAKIDVAGFFLIYRKIIMPLVVPALAALGILEFTWIWNDYLWSLVLIQSDSLKPVTLGLTTLQGEWITSWNVIAAGANLAALIPILVFLIFQRYFIEGLTLGSVKG
jgi:multiple sugar transport system permease protein